MNTAVLRTRRAAGAKKSMVFKGKTRRRREKNEHLCWFFKGKTLKFEQNLTRKIVYTTLGSVLYTPPPPPTGREPTGHAERKS